MKDVLVGTAGHIDHGKTTLLKALTGIDADRLAEEKRRGITIDLGFAHLQLGDLRVGFIDVPGHEKFVKNMLAGIGGIQFVLLVVAADESIMPQTVEHFQICKLLEIPDGLVALTKASSVEADLLELVREEVAEMVAGSFLEGAPVACVDSVTGDGIEDLKELLRVRLEASHGAAVAPAETIFRLPVDRVFSLKGFGTVVTGTPVAGVLQRDSALAVYPRGKVGKVRSVQIFGQKEERAVAGQRTALNLAGLEKADLERGMVLAPAQAFQPTQVLDAALTLLADAPTALKHRSPARFHHGSGEIIARVHLLEGRELAPGQTGVVQIRLAKPTVACVGDHFILRRYSPMRTLGGGIVLDSRPPKRSRKRQAEAAAQLRGLPAWGRPRTPEALRDFLRYFIRQAGRSGVSVRDLAGRTGLVEKAVSSLLENDSETALIGQDPPLAVTRSALERLKSDILTFLERFHRDNPLAAGASQEEVKKRFLDGEAGALFPFILEELRREKKAEAQGGSIRLHGSAVQLSPEQEQIRLSILALFEDRKLQPPTLPEIVERVGEPASKVEEIFYYLLQTGALVRVSGDLTLSGSQAEWLDETVRGAFAGSSGFGVAEFKDLFGVTRKYAIPLLEYLDRRKVTRRVGDQRILV